MPVNLKSNIWIEGFYPDITENGFDAKDKLMGFLIKNFFDKDNLDKLDDVLYEGKTLDIPEDVASMFCDWTFWDEKDQKERRRYYNYGERSVVSYPFLSAKESIESACNAEYCVVYKYEK